MPHKLSRRLLACLTLVATAASLALADLPKKIEIPSIEQGTKAGLGTAGIARSSVRLLSATSGAAGTGPALPAVSASSGPPAVVSPTSVGSPILLSACSATLYTVAVEFPSATSTSFNLAVDTGSSDILVVSNFCDGTCDGDPTQFPVSAPGYTGFEGFLGFGAGEVTGFIFTEDVSLGSSLPAVSQNIVAVINTTTSLFEPSKCLFDLPATHYIDGLIGFGARPMSDSNDDPSGGSIVDYLGQHGVPRVFTTLLCDLGGYLYAGGFDLQSVMQTPSFTPLLTAEFPTKPYYVFNVGSLTLGGQDVGLDVSAQIPWILDTGTNFLVVLGASAAIAALDQMIAPLLGMQNFLADASFPSGSDNFDVNCVSPNLDRSAIDAALPQMEFTIPAVGGGTFTISYPATFAYIHVRFASDGTAQLCPNLFDTTSSVGIFPNSLMNNLEVIFDQVNNQIGFATPDPTLCQSRSSQLQQQPPPPATYGLPVVPSPQASPPQDATAEDALPPPPLALRAALLASPPPTDALASVEPSAPPLAMVASLPPSPPLTVTPAPPSAKPSVLAAPTHVPVASHTSLASPKPTFHRAPHPAPHPKPHPQRHHKPHPKPAVKSHLEPKPHHKPKPHNKPHPKPHRKPHPKPHSKRHTKPQPKPRPTPHRPRKPHRNST